MRHVGSFFPDQGLNPKPLHWERGVLSTGLPGKSLCEFHWFPWCSTLTFPARLSALTSHIGLLFTLQGCPCHHIPALYTQISSPCLKLNTEEASLFSCSQIDSFSQLPFIVHGATASPTFQVQNLKSPWLTPPPVTESCWIFLKYLPHISSSHSAVFREDNLYWIGQLLSLILYLLSLYPLYPLYSGCFVQLEELKED